MQNKKYFADCTTQELLAEKEKKNNSAHNLIGIDLELEKRKTAEITPRQSLEKMREALINFNKAGNALCMAWEMAGYKNPDKSITIEDYPEDLPSFDELIASISTVVNVKG